MYETCYTHSPVPCKLHDGLHDDTSVGAPWATAKVEFDRAADSLAAELRAVGYTGGGIVNYFIRWAERWGGNG